MLKIPLEEAKDVNFIIVRTDTRSPVLYKVRYIKHISIKKDIYIIDYEAYDFFSAGTSILKLNIRSEKNNKFSKNGYFWQKVMGKVLIKEEGIALAIYKKILEEIELSFQKEIEKLLKRKNTTKNRIGQAEKILELKHPEVMFMNLEL